MHRNKFLLSLFLGIIILIPVFYGISIVLAGVTTVLAILVLMILLIQYLSDYERKIQKKVRIEFFSSFRNNILKAYLGPKNVWVVYDRAKKRFRAADFRDLPINVGVLGLFGLILLYIAYLIIIAVPYSTSLVIFRIVTSFALALVGFYNVFVAGDRFFALQSKKSENLSKRLNTMRSLRNFAVEKENNVEITPNFLLPDGFITSVEFLSKKDMDRKKLERILIDVSNRMKRI
jgi:Na+-transporting methylmalonyl-CoA/oxaloacetate decarboxylase gamma subunit